MIFTKIEHPMKHLTKKSVNSSGEETFIDNYYIKNNLTGIAYSMVLAKLKDTGDYHMSIAASTSNTAVRKVERSEAIDIIYYVLESELKDNESLKCSEVEHPGSVASHFLIKK